MDSPAQVKISINDRRGELHVDHATPATLEWLKHLDEHLEDATAHLIYRVRNRIFKLPYPIQPSWDGVCIKSFATPSLLRGYYYGQNKGKARRAFQYALHLERRGVGVPTPLGFTEQVINGRLIASEYFSAYLGDTSNFDAEMNHLLRNEPDYTLFLALLRQVAVEVRRMHDSGFVHNDLAGQNILLRRAGPATWTGIGFIDLNRGRILPSVPLRLRARDMARLQIPSNLRRVFFNIYFGDAPIPETFAKWEARYRAHITLHNQSRNFRHPIRYLRNRRRYIQNQTIRQGYKDMWLWDPKTGQPGVMLSSDDRLRYRHWCDVLGMLGAAVRCSGRVYQRYIKLRGEAFARPVSMNGRAGLSLELDGDHLEKQFYLLETLPDASVWLRVYHHKGAAGIEACAAAINRLAVSGRQIGLAIVQCRLSILNPDSWRDFVYAALDRMGTKLTFVEIGHAINRVKWGLWGLREIVGLCTSLGDLKARHPGILFLGPAVNDFEYQYFPPLLEKLRGRLHGLSCHLYVDRVGAPENPQCGFGSDGKALLGRAIAEAYDLRGFYITEVNWPLLGSGEYSPVRAAYALPGLPESPLHVGEETCADYMIRYFLLTLCGGGAERLWWWRLAGRGLGLVDDFDGFRPRAGWEAFVTWHKETRRATFLSMDKDGPVRIFRFDRMMIVYASQPITWQVPSTYQIAMDVRGRSLPNEAVIELAGSPIYLFPSERD